MIVKNYKELCDILEVPQKGGRSKVLQLEDLQKYMRYEKEGHKFIIKEILSTQYVEVDDRGLNPNSHKNQNGAYGKYIRLLILNMLSQGQSEDQHKKKIITIGKTHILQELNMINENYKYSSYNRDAMAHYLGMDIEIIHEFFNTNTRKLRQAVETTMNRLMNNEKLIFWNTVKLININGVHREATDEEIKYILNCERNTLEEMGFKDINGVYATNRIKEFYKRINIKLREKGIYYSYNAYKIILADSVYKRNEQLNYKLELEDEISNKSELNNTVDKRFTISAESRHIKVKNEANRFYGEPPKEWLEQNNNYKRIVMEDNFVTDNKILINVCIDDTYDSICEQVANAWKQFQKDNKGKLSKTDKKGMSSNDTWMEILDDLDMDLLIEGE